MRIVLVPKFDKYQFREIEREHEVQPMVVRHFSTQSYFQWQMELFRTMSESKPVAVCQELFVASHEQLGLPWWVTVIATTLAVRLFITFPLKVFQVRIDNSMLFKRKTMIFLFHPGSNSSQV
jgi:membrane protein insertase Oxa1/YidC/SpoIIIJ